MSLKLQTPLPLYYWQGKRERVLDVIKTLFLFQHYRIDNVGDALSPIVVSALSGEPVCHQEEGQKFLAIGSVLFSLGDRDVVWGSGLHNPEQLAEKKSVKDVHIAAVRGPETRGALLKAGFNCPEVFGDPGLLAPLFFQPEVPLKHRIGVVPHFVHHLRAIRKFGGRTRIITPCMNWRKFFTSICECQYIVSTSLHGIILAEALGIKAVPALYGRYLDNTPFKFLDYYGSTGRTPQFIDLETEELTEAKVEEMTSRIGPLSFDVKPLLEAFPFPIKHREIAELMRDGSEILVPRPRMVFPPKNPSEATENSVLKLT